ncbi:unnamed protein product [Durusdinium trenchii]|uniref:Sulfotransferase n=1 Tax=Durusdinium trenchii TaxID=1381693 RepID=A0ABP0L232_9DINO
MKGFLVSLFFSCPGLPSGSLSRVSSDWARRLCQGRQLWTLPDVPVCTEDGSCESYSLGSGFCTSWMALPWKTTLKAPIGTPSWESCTAQGFYARQGEVFQHPPPLLNCPLAVPLAILSVPKSASSTFLVWLATLEGRSEANLLAALAARRCLEHTQDPQRAKSCFAKALYHRYANYSSRLPGLNLEAFGCHRSDVNALADYGLRFQQDMRTGWLVVPPFMCQQCCTQGYGRLLVVLGRNPYMRLASYFQRRTGPKVPGSKAVDWSKFKGWVRLLHNITTNTNSFQTLRGVPHLIGSDDLLHLRSAKEMLDDARILPGRSQRDFTVVHQETLEADLKALERQLCRRFGSCSALPPLPKQKERSERSSCGTPGRPRKCCNKWRLVMATCVLLAAAGQFA